LKCTADEHRGFDFPVSERAINLPTRTERFWEGVRFWLSAYVGTTAAGAFFGLLIGLLGAIWALFAGEVSSAFLVIIFGPLIGGCIAGTYAFFVHIHIAILTWAFWLTRYRVTAAGIAGCLVGVLSCFGLSHPSPPRAGLGWPGVWVGMPGLFGAIGSAWAGHRFTQSDSSRNIRGKIPRAERWQFTLRDLLIHFTVLTVLISLWASAIRALK
jgi:hypothetical protein